MPFQMNPPMILTSIGLKDLLHTRGLLDFELHLFTGVFLHLDGNSFTRCLIPATSLLEEH